MSGDVQNVLLVEDNPGDAFLIQKMLEPLAESGFRLLTVASLSQAEQALAITDFAISLLDLGLPDSQGLDTLQSIKQLSPGLPIIVLTGLEDKTLSIQSLQQGAQDYLIKGTINRTWLINTLHHSIKRSQILKTLHQRELALKTSNHSLKQQVVEKTSQLIQTHEQLNLYQTLANIDPLTNLANRRYFDIRLHNDWQNSIKDKAPLSLLMIDLDDFKRFNDTYGHPQGDFCLRQVAKSIQSALQRPHDLAARYGGEEFIVLLPNANETSAIAVAERILMHIQVLAIPHHQSRVSSIVTASIGIGTGYPSVGDDPQTVLDEADKALYFSKHEGRDRWSLGHATRLQKVKSGFEQYTFSSARSEQNEVCPSQGL